MRWVCLTTKLGSKTMFAGATCRLTEPVLCDVLSSQSPAWRRRLKARALVIGVECPWPVSVSWTLSDLDVFALTRFTAAFCPMHVRIRYFQCNATCFVTLLCCFAARLTIEQRGSFSTSRQIIIASASGRRSASGAIAC